MISQIETMVLERLAEDLTTPQVWSGNDDRVRKAVRGAIDELLALGLFHREFLLVPLVEGKTVYEFTSEGTVIGVLSMRLEGQARVLTHRTMAWISAQDRLFLMSRGTPWVYCVMDFRSFMVYPTPSEGGDILEIEVFLLPNEYVGGEYVAEITPELVDAVVSLAYSNVQLAVPGGLAQAVQGFQEFMEMAPQAEGHRRSWNSYMHFWQKGLGENGNGS